jgi:Xanthine and CO dehydrogenases maturation factor, XdhC/CoxF family
MSHETFELIDLLLQRLRQTGRRAAMATLVRTAGTTPRKEGTKMFVGDDGGIFGSVTIGGCVDARVIEHSVEVLGTSSPQLLKMDLGDEEAWEIGLTCGGSVEVFIEPLSESVIQMYETARREWQAGRSVAVATVISGDAVGSQVLVDSNGLARGPAPAELTELLRNEVPRLLRSNGGSRTLHLGASEVYIEILRPPSKLLVFGAGAVAIPLVTFAKALGFQTIVVDGRARFASRERFPDADDINVGIASEIAEQMDLGPTTPVVLVAHDYKIDVPVLKKALASDTPYIGLLGSRRRGAAILQMLRDDGVPEEQLSRIRVPIGLDLGGETAAEIALSIISEVLAVMRGRSGSAMSALGARASRPLVGSLQES